MNSPSLVLATTAMAAVSSTVLFLAFSWHKPPLPHEEPHPPEQVLRSCLRSDGKKKERNKKKKKVRFADDVKEPRGNGDEFRMKMKMKEIRKSSPVERSCRSEIPGIPANRVALYSGILRDRANRMECSR
ncbi:hypothetical protein ACJRO7_005852 [Eucalyptus globulus]|uniref:Uncharacterized protein n=1 Tax=Eucalyptus globulus TaxID=34317 RepID=A0ABD3J3H1_EUCGL